MTKKKTSLLKRAIYPLVLFLIIGIIFHRGFQTYWNDGGSMMPTVSDGQLILVNKIYYDYVSVERYDVVALWDAERKENLIKRIVGLPNETVELRQGRIIVNGSPLLNDPFENAQHDYRQDFGPYKIPSDSYFYFGDDRESSTWGIVKGKNIKGKVVLK
jgi:signal peptidase I